MQRYSSDSLSEEENNKEVNSNPTFNASTLWKNKNSIYLVLVTVLEAAIIITLEAIFLAKFNQSLAEQPENEGLQKGVPVYLSIFIFSLVFQVGLAWDAVRNKNTIQIIAFILFNLCCFGYTVFQFKQITEAIKSVFPNGGGNVDNLQRIVIASPVISGICQLVYFYLGARLYLEYGWRIYKKIGADPDIRRDAEYPLTIVALPATCVALVLAVYAVRHESKQLMALFFVGLAAGVAYFIFKICRIYDASQAWKYKYVNEVLTFFACVTLFLLLLTIINAAICWSNFDKGLKGHLLRDLDHPSTSFEGNGGRTLSLD
ncbi:hypothetical protein G6F56_010287 [Rhizopus delemar]|nr:hypothetical protein G6F56_010287 [Rhizopus delemar]